MLGLVLGVIFTLSTMAAFYVRASSVEERRHIGWGCIAHILGMGAMIWFASRMHGDMALYASYGRAVSEVLASDPVRWSPEAVKLFLHLDNALPAHLEETGSVGSMIALTGFGFLVTAGGVVEGVMLFVGVFAFVGRVLLYKALREDVRPSERQYVAIAAMALPSVVFWTGGILKETWAFAGMGLAVYGARRLAARRGIVLMLPLVGVGLLLMGLLKPYLLFPLLLGVAAWIVVRSGRQLSIGYLLGGVAVAVIGFAVMGALFPRYDPGQIGSSIVAQQQAFASVGGGRSSVDIGGDEDGGDAAQVVFVPLAMVNTFFRPFIVEARSFTQIGAALETTVILLVVLSLLFRGGLVRIVREVRSSSVLLAGAILVTTMGIALGLSTPNLGSLSRYRVPMMPFYVMVVLILRERVFGKSTEAIKQTGAPVPPVQPSPFRRRSAGS